MRSSVALQNSPSWLQCELCDRAGSASRRLAPLYQPDEGESASPDSLVLLCPDCCALVRGEITEAEWRRRSVATS